MSLSETETFTAKIWIA